MLRYEDEPLDPSRYTEELKGLCKEFSRLFINEGKMQLEQKGPIVYEALNADLLAVQGKRKKHYYSPTLFYFCVMMGRTFCNENNGVYRHQYGARKC